MAALDFPASPTLGQTFPSPAEPGVPQYTWNGYAWVTGPYTPSDFVKKSGDTMTGDLNINVPTTHAALRLNKVGSGFTSVIRGGTLSYSRWLMHLGNETPETGAHAGSDFILQRTGDAGEFLGYPLTVSRQTGLAVVSGDPTAPLGIATKQYAEARALDAMAYSGMQINGSMEVSQEVGNTGTNTNGGYGCDGWAQYRAGTMVAALVRLPGSPFPGFPYKLQFGATTAQASLGASDYAQIIQTIEGYRIARLAWGTANAKPLTVGFWTAHSRTGLYSVSLHNAGSSRSCILTYTQAVANTPQYNVLTFPGCTDGTWNIDNASGLSLGFVLACGTTYIAPSTGAWLAGNYLAASGQVNAVATTSDAFIFSGVVVLPGIYAPTAAQSPLIMRPYDQELMTCMRYFELMPLANFLAVGQATAATVATIPFIPFKAVKRTNPAISVVGGTVSVLVANGGGGGGTFTYSANTHGFVSTVAGASGLVAGNATLVFAQTGAPVFHADARL